MKGVCRLWQVQSTDGQSSPKDIARFSIDSGYEKAEIRRTLPQVGSNLKHFDKVYSIGPKMAFSLIRPPDAQDYLVETIGSTWQDQTPYLSAIGRIIKSHYCVQGFPMSRTIASPYFKLVDVNRIKQDGQSLVRLDYEFGRKEPLQKVTVMFDANAGWVIRSSDCRYGVNSAPRMTAEIEYGPTSGEIVFPKRMSITDEFKNRSVCEILSYQLDTTSESQFKMPFYGLPDLLAPPATRVVPPIGWIAGFLAAGLTIAVVLKRYIKRGSYASRAKSA